MLLLHVKMLKRLIQFVTWSSECIAGGYGPDIGAGCWIGGGYNCEEKNNQYYTKCNYINQTLH